MARERSARDWDHTSQVLAMLHNVNRGPDSKAAKPDHFHPYRQPKADAPAQVVTKVPLSFLRDVFVKQPTRS